jgi:hypothetical protein
MVHRHVSAPTQRRSCSRHDEESEDHDTCSYSPHGDQKCWRGCRREPAADTLNGKQSR